MPEHAESIVRDVTAAIRRFMRIFCGLFDLKFIAAKIAIIC
jgi:hypothetical protein